MKKYTIDEIALIILYRTSNPMLFCCEVHGNCSKIHNAVFCQDTLHRYKKKKTKVISHILDLSKLKLEVHMKSN